VRASLSEAASVVGTGVAVGVKVGEGVEVGSGVAVAVGVGAGVSVEVTGTSEVGVGTSDTLLSSEHAAKRTMTAVRNSTILVVRKKFFMVFSSVEHAYYSTLTALINPINNIYHRISNYLLKFLNGKFRI
jgi:hypothetical protein